jgi:hypothetical protein
MNIKAYFFSKTTITAYGAFVYPLKRGVAVLKIKIGN